MASIRLTVAQADREDVYRDIARVQERYRKDVNGVTLSEGEVCKITVEETGRSTLVILRGRHGRDEKALWIDERTREKLKVSVGDETSFRLEADLWFGAWRWAKGSSDVAYRICSQLALLSVALGVLGLILGVVSLCK